MDYDNYKKLTDWKNEPVFDDLNNDFIEAQSAQEKIRTKLLEWAEVADGGKKVNAGKYKSKTRPKLVRKQREWKYPPLEEPFLSNSEMFDVKPRTFEDTKAAIGNGIILNYQFDVVIDKVKLVGDAVRSIVDDGTVIVKTGWEVEERAEVVQEERPIKATPEESFNIITEAMQTGKMTQEEGQAMLDTGELIVTGTELVDVKRMKLIKNQPVYEVCNVANVYIDPTCEGVLKNANFVIHEFDSNLATLKKQEFVVDAETGEESGVYKNISKVISSVNADSFGSYSSDFYSDEYNSFDFTDKARKKIRVYEYWGYWDIRGDDTLVPIIATWANDILIRLEENPFPHRRLPFSMATYMPVKKEIHGQPDAEILKDNQDIIGNMTRAAIDITATQAIGQTFIDQNFLPNIAAKNSYKNNETVYYRSGFNPKEAIYKQTVDPVPDTVFTMLQEQNAEAESLSATRAFGNSSGGTALGSSATGIRSALDATSKRELSILRRMSEMFKDMAIMTIAMNQVYLSPKEIVRITNEDFREIKRDDLKGTFDLRVDVSTPERDAETAEGLAFVLQTNAATMDPMLANKTLAKIMRLKNQPDLAKVFEEFKPPEPSKAEKELQELQLENARLENQRLHKEIENLESLAIERVSRTRENEKDAIVRDASAQEKLAKADKLRAESEKLKAEADILDQQFLLEEDGHTQKRKEEADEFKALTEIEKLKYKENNKNANLSRSTK